ncbi:MAG: hypothetical protein ABS70_03255 [Nitrospira sp. SCN 59-13]|nr:MAG: hypothetical protein ABS70_03255 [Nitrospira sp. SCN 59-13]
MSQDDASPMGLSSRGITIALALLAITTLPLLGPWLDGRSLRPYLEFPPLSTGMVTPAPFSWPIFIGLSMLIIGLLAPLIVRVARTNAGRMSVSSTQGGTSHGTVRRERVIAPAFPWWGWGTVVWTVCVWFLAWTRLDWMQAWQPHTFTPLWLGYIVVVNALTYRSTGRCMLIHRPRYFLSLFPLSACFWWLFEYLNRFVENWYYVGGGTLTTWEYLIRATLPFATVLPAVLSTAEWLTACPRLSAGLDHGVAINLSGRRTGGWLLFCGAAAGLLGIGLWPAYLFPLVWVAPLLVITALQLIRDEPTIFSETAHGDWRTLWAVALAALICGWFWEMWNFYSLAHWQYAVPFVQGVTLFHMPLLGYAGYLPFGLECLAVANLCLARKFAGGVAYYREGEPDTDFAQRNPTVADR